jgi:FKBP-type peptidyl-prolyl cis-trans isomerase FkpA
MNLKKNTVKIAALLSVMACGQFKVNESENGDRYQIHEKGDSDISPEFGDVLKLNLKIVSELDSVFTDTWLMGAPIEVPLEKGTFKGSFENALTLLHKGDSATVYVPADSIFAYMGQPLPPGVPANSDLKFIVRILDIKSNKELRKELENKKDEESGIISEFVKENLPAAVKLENGIYYTTQKEGAGAAVNVGDTVVVSYVGRFMDGNIFDQNETFTFPVGLGYVISGWDEALKTMKTGQKSTFVIPSELAYGERGAGSTIPPFTPLVFEIQLNKIGRKK